MSRLALIGLAVTGCISSRSTRIVRDVAVVGQELVVETCSIGTNNDVAVGDCSTIRQPVPVLVVPAAPPPAPAAAELTFRIARSEIAAQLTAARDAMASCASKHGASAPLEVRLQVHGGGFVTTATTEAGGTGLDACLTEALATIRFVVQPQGLGFTFKPVAK